MTVTLDTLELTPPELESSKDAVQKMAYFNWINAGCPDGQQLDSWLLAEREWIEYCYVPSRPCDGDRSQSARPEAVAEGAGGREPSPQTSNRLEAAMAE